MRLYTVVSWQSAKVIEFFATRMGAEEFIAEVEADEPETATWLEVVPFGVELAEN